jgi:hypothetical protein
MAPGFAAGFTSGLGAPIYLKRAKALFARCFGLNETTIPLFVKDCRFRDQYRRSEVPAAQAANPPQGLQIEKRY